MSPRFVRDGKGDWLTVGGLPYVAPMRYGLRKPKDSVPGFDVAGRIAAVGSNVTHTQPGDEVFGWCDGSLRVLDMLNGSWARLIRAGVRTFGMA
jgi:NADPH:quinone reductase-like Zn-dependent oxidoreductase